VVLGLSLASCGGSGGGNSSGGDAKTTDGTSPTTSPPATDLPLLPDAFESVCQGATVSTATAYDATATSHKALYFATYEDSLLDQSTDLPADWTVVFSATGNPLQAVDLVACAVRTADKLVQTCTGYQDKGKDTGNEVRWHTATYDVSVHAATTGEVLKQITVEASDKACPSFVMFDQGQTSVDQWASVPKEKVVALLRRFVQGS
jgi:hypothetical protein